MSFQDQAHVDHIRDALWRRHPIGHAAVMVGAGFSRSARPISVSSRPMLTWEELARLTCDQLYPVDDATIANQRKAALTQATATSGFLRLAQEFKAAFGRTTLDNLIYNAVPDYDYEPGDLHTLLLRLPWSDIFTTNWDTLLERTRPNVFGRNYDVVRTPSEIPNSIRPRIIKLHGSFPANKPFILTEDDYRQYPSEFAPFVNLVQQSMMENIFCLIGFSGDDPNFLYWSGWVRDNLGSSAPKIYLIGWLDLSTHRRRMLEDRNVVPVDLSRFPQAQTWPEDFRHRYAIEWFILNLERGEPYRVTNWPSTYDPKTSVTPDYLGDIPTTKGNRPKEEPPSLSSSLTNDDQRTDELKKVVSIWKYNRLLYPGWIVAPSSVRLLIWLHTEQWLADLVRLLSKLPTWDQLFTLNEMIWRLDLCLIPLPSDVIKEAMRVLDEIDPILKTYLLKTEQEPLSNPDWAAVRKEWSNLAVAVLRYFRENGNQQEFDRWLSRLSPFINDNSEVSCAVNYERCLFALNRLDHDALNDILDKWDFGHSDPFWAIRKAAILAEIQRLKDAFPLARNALDEIRRTTRRDIDDIALLSREAWAMYLLLGFDKPWQKDSDTGGLERENHFARWESLSIYKCDAFNEFQLISTEIEKQQLQRYNFVEETPEFDLGAKIIHRHYRGGYEWEHLIPAYQLRRLTEVAGIPPRVEASLARSSLMGAALQLAEDDPQSAISIILRVCDYEGDKVFKEFFTRNRIALLKEKDISNLVTILERVIDYIIPRAFEKDGRMDYYIGRLRVAVELLSRIVLRLPSVEAERSLKRAIAFFSSELFRHAWLTGPLDHLFTRSIEAIEPDHREAYILPLVSLPLVGADGFNVMDNNRWPEPIKSIDKKKVSLLRPTSPNEWDNAVKKIILGAQTPAPARPRAVDRLLNLYIWGLLRDYEKEQFAAALWHPAHLSPSGLPGDTNIRDFAFLDLPEPESELAEKRFRGAYLTPDGGQYKKASFADYFYEIGAASEGSQRRRGPLVFSEAEIRLVSEKVRSWVNHKESLDIPDPFEKHKVKDNVWLTVRGLATILPILRPTQQEIELIWQKINDLDLQGFPVHFIYPSILKVCPPFSKEIAFKFRIGLASDEKSQAEDAINGLGFWIRNKDQLGIESPPDDLIREVGIAIRFRRVTNLRQALRIAEWLFCNQPDTANRLIADLAEHGLNYLLAESCYETQNAPSVKPYDHDISLIRRGCIKLACSIQKAGHDSETVQKWIEAGRTDPLPEVRYAQSSENS